MERRRAAPWVVDVLPVRQPALNDALVDRLIPYTSQFPDETRIGDLRVLPRHLRPHLYAKWGFLPDYSPPKGWERIYRGFTQGQKIRWSMLINRLTDMGFERIGQLRELSYEDLSTIVVTYTYYRGTRYEFNQIYTLHPRLAAFVKGIFE